MSADRSVAATGERERAHIVITILRELYPNAKTSLDFTTPLDLLVATMLSAQCTDAVVNTVTPALFKKYPTAAAYAGATQEELEQDIRKITFYRNKAKHIHEMARILVENYGGEVPRDMADLIKLPGVARKTANVVMGNAYGIVEGVVVDTHVGRLSRRLGFTENDDPVKVEQDLMALFPQSDWLDLSHLMIYHGRAVCQARRPLCEVCALAPHCPTGQANLTAAAVETQSPPKTRTSAKRRA